MKDKFRIEITLNNDLPGGLQLDEYSADSLTRELTMITMFALASQSLRKEKRFLPSLSELITICLS